MNGQMAFKSRGQLNYSRTIAVKNKEIQGENQSLCTGSEACIAECPEDAIAVRKT